MDKLKLCYSLTELISACTATAFVIALKHTIYNSHTKIKCTLLRTYNDSVLCSTLAGLEKMSTITSSGKYELRVDMEDFDGVKRYAHYR